MTKKTTDLAEAKRFLNGVPLPVLAAVSGGLDSMCLLHLLSTWGKANHMEVTAAHFNHRLRGPMADRDEAFVKRICEEWEIPCVCGQGDTRALAEAEGLSLEEAARTLRYQFLEETRRSCGAATILTAHHADDNAETLLFHLLRGTGLQGLTGIPAFRDGIARPFLRVSREKLEAYAKEYNIPHVEDETNELDDAARNVLRHRVLPVLKELNPRAVENMIRTAELLAQDEKALEVGTGKLLLEVERDRDSVRLPLRACEKQPRALISRAVFSMMVQVCGHQKDLSAAHVEAVLDLLRSGTGKEVALPYGMTARRMEDSLLICRMKEPAAQAPIHLGETVDFGEWSVAVGVEPAVGGLCYALRPEESLLVTGWRPTDRMTLSGGRGARSLKRLCADAGIRPWERDSMPVLRVGETLAAAPGIGVDLKFLPREEYAVIYVTFHHKKEERQYEK